VGGKGYAPVETRAAEIPGSSRQYYDLSERALDNFDVIRRLDYSPGCERELKGAEIILRKPSAMQDDATMKYFLRLAMSIVDEIVSRGGTTGVVILQNTRAQSGTCQVCGGGLTGRVTACARCATPHHAECWTYVGRCSTYGRVSTRFG
jgi:hypothetical protein